MGKVSLACETTLTAGSNQTGGNGTLTVLRELPLHARVPLLGVHLLDGGWGSMQYLEIMIFSFLLHNLTPGVLFQLPLAVMDLLLENICNFLHNARRNSAHPPTQSRRRESAQSAELKTPNLGLKRIPEVKSAY